MHLAYELTNALLEANRVIDTGVKATGYLALTSDQWRALSTAQEALSAIAVALLAKETAALAKERACPR